MLPNWLQLFCVKKYHLSVLIKRSLNFLSLKKNIFNITKHKTHPPPKKKHVQKCDNSNKNTIHSTCTHMYELQVLWHNIIFINKSDNHLLPAFPVLILKINKNQFINYIRWVKQTNQSWIWYIYCTGVPNKSHLSTRKRLWEIWGE